MDLHAVRPPKPLALPRGARVISRGHAVAGLGDGREDRVGGVSMHVYTR